MIVTEDRETAARPFLEHVPGLTAAQGLELPVVLAGTVEEKIAAQVRAHRDRYGFTRTGTGSPV